jgi:hypothetical protein
VEVSQQQHARPTVTRPPLTRLSGYEKRLERANGVAHNLKNWLFWRGWFVGMMALEEGEEEQAMEPVQGYLREAPRRTFNSLKDEVGMNTTPQVYLPIRPFAHLAQHHPIHSVYSHTAV